MYRALDGVGYRLGQLVEIAFQDIADIGRLLAAVSVAPLRNQRSTMQNVTLSGSDYGSPARAGNIGGGTRRCDAA